MKSIYTAILIGILSLSSSLSFAFDASKVPAKKKTTLGLYLSAKEAYDMAKKGKVLFLDVRSREEVNFLGMPTVADANIPYMEMDAMHSWNETKNSFKLEPNSAFVSLVADRVKAKGMTKDSPIIVMCRSGDRSAHAANLLAKDGYTKVYSIVEGFEGDMSKDGRRSMNGWKNAGLPWSYKLAKTKMSLE
jgi:rhodanese-related sulfurtransferase